MEASVTITMLYFQIILSNHKNNPLPITCHSPLYSSSSFLETTNLFCDSLDLPILGISDKENPIPCASISFSVWLKSIQQYWSTVLYLSLHQLMDIHAECCHLYLIWVSVCDSDKWPAKLFPKIDLPFYISLIGESSSLHFYRHLILDYFILWRSGFCCTGFLPDNSELEGLYKGAYRILDLSNAQGKSGCMIFLVAIEFSQFISSPTKDPFVPTAVTIVMLCPVSRGPLTGQGTSLVTHSKW